MNDSRFDDPYRDLQAALDVEPSPEFAARVRVSVEDRSARRSWTWTRAAVVAGVCVVLAIMVLHVRRDAPTPATLPTIAQERPPETSRVTTPAAAPMVAVSASDRHATHVTMSLRRTSHAAEPEVLVPGDQLMALRQLAAGLRDGRLDADNLPASLFVSEPEQDAPESGAVPGSDVIRKIALASPAGE